MSTLWPVVLLPALAALILFRRPLVRFLRLLWRSLGSLAVLALMRPAAAALGICIGVNCLNALVLGILGIPGLGLLLMLQWLLHAP